MEKATIIKRALIKLGLPFNNKNLEEDSLFKAASFLLDDDGKSGGILREILTTSTFSFNLKRCTPTISKTDKGMYEYNKPPKYLDFVWSNHLLEEVGEKFYSKSPGLEIIYKEDKDIAELPDQAQQLIILKLAYELAPTANQTKALGAIYEEMEMLKSKLECIGGIPTVDPYEGYDFYGGDF